MWPRREEDLLAGGGSVYWVIQGVIQCRQKIIRLDEVVGSDGIRRCAIVLEPELIRTSPALKRPFQGWRYLEAKDAPHDVLVSEEDGEEMPTAMVAELRELGLL